MLNRRTLLMAGAALPLAAFLGGCAHPQRIGLGETEESVRAALGEPASRMKLADGTVRLVYSRQPMGQEVWWMYFDRNGRYIRLENAMTEKAFSLTKPGVTTRAEVLQLFGPCAQEYDLKLFDQSALMYRFQSPDVGDAGVWFQFNRQNILTEWGVTEDPWRSHFHFRS